MQVVLNADVKKLGYRGEVVVVKPGYFRNFLYPQGLAIVADKKQLELAEMRKEKVVLKKQQVQDDAKGVLAKLNGLVIKIEAKASEKGSLYASIGEKEVIDAVKKEAKVELSEDMISMQHIKEVGEHEVIVEIGDLKETVKVVVESK